jgi:hypothetical protein
MDRNRSTTVIADSTVLADGAPVNVIDRPAVPVSFVPTPTREYRDHNRRVRVTATPTAPHATAGPILIPIPHPPIPPIFLAGARVLMWKQDPSVAEIGIRKAFLPAHVFAGPKDARIVVSIAGMPPVNPNAFQDYIETPGTNEFDAVHTFAVVRETLTMYQRALGALGVTILPFQWNTGGNTDPIQVLPHQSVMQNAFYSRGGKSLNFGFFPKPGAPAPAPTVFTCQSLDIVAHETGHSILDGLKPNWIGASSNPQTGALHEAFGDLTAIFLALSQFDQVEALIAQTKSNLHDKNFLSDLAEQFGLVLGRLNGLRNADNDFKLSQVGTEVHSLSQVFTGFMYDVLADIFAFERNPAREDDAHVLYRSAQYLQSLMMRAIIAAPAANATFVDVINQMLTIAAADGKPVQYRNFIRNRATVREIVVSPTPLTEDHEEGLALEAGYETPYVPGTVQDRHRCCGTMQLPEYYGTDETLQAEIDALRKSLTNGTLASMLKDAEKQAEKPAKVRAK